MNKIHQAWVYSTYHAQYLSCWSQVFTMYSGSSHNIMRTCARILKSITAMFWLVCSTLPLSGRTRLNHDFISLLMRIQESRGIRKWKTALPPTALMVAIWYPIISSPLLRLNLLSCIVILAPYHSWHCLIRLLHSTSLGAGESMHIYILTDIGRTSGLHLSISSPSSSSLGSVLGTCVGWEEDRIKVVGQPLFPSTLTHSSSFHPTVRHSCIPWCIRYHLHSWKSRMIWLHIHEDVSGHMQKIPGYVQMMNTINITYMRSGILGWLSDIMWQ